MAKRQRRGRSQTPAVASAEVSRRDFMRRSAQAAVLTLFGTLTLDEVVNKVIARMEEWRGIDRLARQTVRHWGGVAFADITHAACLPYATFPPGPG
ncbi:MAG: twin-arginine translocation signal domain-containing protein [Abditibacteriales bacterium]|nr:twin-arginine translocation signal domain-containing protein [Abditibacteriales bacterium]